VVIAFGVGLLAGLLGSANLAGGGYFLLQGAMALVVAPVAANWLYYRHCAKLVAASEPGLSRERKLARLEAKGGTSNIVLIVVGIFGGIAAIGILAAIALPAYQDYTNRAKVSQLLINSTRIAQQFGDEYSRTGTMPADISQLPSHPELPRYARGMRFNRSLGAIEIDSTLMPYRTDASIYLVPQIEDNKVVAWNCKASASMQKLVPKSCRDQ